MTTAARAVPILAAAALAVVPAAAGLPHTGPPTGSAPQTGKQLYRKYCGQCHALSAAMSAGFGTENGLGTNGGPSFNTLRVPYAIAVEALTMPFIGHEVLVHKLDWAQINEVSRYLASATSAHPVRAYSTDG